MAWIQIGYVYFSNQNVQFGSSRKDSQLDQQKYKLSICWIFSRQFHLFHTYSYNMSPSLCSFYHATGTAYSQFLHQCVVQRFRNPPLSSCSRLYIPYKLYSTNFATTYAAQITTYAKPIDYSLKF